MEGRIVLSQREAKRMRVLEQYLAGNISRWEAAEHIGITLRQLSRLKKRYEHEGAGGLTHGNRGRIAKHALSEELTAEVVRLFEEKYYDCNHTHYTELLAEEEKISLSVSSVSRILKSHGHVSKKTVKRRGKRMHLRRDRRSQCGMLWQTDATLFEWFGAAHGKFTLHAIIDDATGIVTGATFMQNECAEGYVRVLCDGIRHYGVPMALYSDRHAIFHPPKEAPRHEQGVDGEPAPLSQIGKALAELQIEHIKALTPQAKGRIERLWETLQDRLVVELRLLGIQDIQAANHALPALIAKHNKRFAVPAEEEQTSYLPLPATTQLEYVFARRTIRKIDNGGVLSYKSTKYRPSDTEVSWRAKTAVEVRETSAGEICIWHKGQAIALRKVGWVRCLKKAEIEAVYKKPRRPYEDIPDYPWPEWISWQTLARRDKAKASTIDVTS